VKYKVDFISHRGKIRAKNEDNAYINGRYREDVEESIWQYKEEFLDNALLAVFDGVGGERGGETASKIAAQTMDEYNNGCFTKNIMDYIYEVNFRISTNTNRKMATTYAAVSIEDNIYHFSNIGDSKGYLCRNGKLRKMTKDHNTVQLLVEEGLLTEEQAKKHPQRHVIYQALGMQEEDIEPEPYISEKQNAQEGDLLLLCTDGVTDMITEAEIEEILLDKMIQNKAKIIVDRAMEKGGKDNITALIVEVKED
jgi:serine/threonine protein phosphatase PrpC